MVPGQRACRHSLPVSDAVQKGLLGCPLPIPPLSSYNYLLVNNQMEEVTATFQGFLCLLLLVLHPNDLVPLCPGVLVFWMCILASTSWGGLQGLLQVVAVGGDPVCTVTHGQGVGGDCFCFFIYTLYFLDN